MEIESLPGPAARCSFQHAEYGRCAVQTTMAIKATSFFKLRFSTENKIILHGRVMCSQHVDYMRDFMPTES